MTRCSPRRIARLGTTLAVLLLGFAAAGFAAEPLAVESTMLVDPELTLEEPGYVFSEKLKPLWMAALARGESEPQRLAADAISNATARGMTGLEDAVDALLELAEAGDTDEIVRCAAARALIALDARQAAEGFVRHARDGSLRFTQLVEPALARWDNQSIRTVWLERVRDASTAHLLLHLAIEGLGTVRDERAGEPLLALVRTADLPANVRFAAATSLGGIRRSGLLPVARELAPEGTASIPDRLVAGILLREHEGEEVVGFLRGLAVDEEPAVAAVAWDRLLELDPSLVYDLAPQTILRPDARLRRLGATALVAKGDPEAIRTVGPLLDDHNPGNRRYVAASLAELATQEALTETVVDVARQMLQDGSWRGLEQACLVLGRLDDEPAGERFVELLEHERGEVYVAAAWALRMIQVPETLPPMLEIAEKQFQRFADQSIGEHFLPASRQLSQLFQAFGQMRYLESHELMRKCVPKIPLFDVEMRAAACWALGYLYEDNPQEDLAKQLGERLADVNSLPPEWELVCQMSAISLGRMRAESALPVLRRMAAYFGLASEPGLACYWALERITGEPMPAAERIYYGVGGWFLEPLTR